jgi:phage-related protein
MARRPVIYVGRSQRDLHDFPEDVQDVVILALLEAADGFKHQDAVPMEGFHGASVLEIRIPFKTDAYRVVYTTSVPGAICVLHAFKKKSRQGREMPKPDMDLIWQRLRVATELHARGELP